jgi:tripeptide aminopeptidase
LSREIIKVRITSTADGSQLSFRGLLTPNIFIGGYNCHGKYEYAVVSEMEKAVQVVINIIQLYAEGKQVK